MTLVTYEFYTEAYKGDVVADSSVFDKWLIKATAFLNRVTFNHIVFENEQFGQYARGLFEPFTDEELKAVQYGLCLLIDTMVALDKTEKQAVAGTTDAGNIKSKSSGGESVTYESKTTVYDEALKDNGKKMKIFRDALMDYMPPSAFRYNPYYAGER